MSIYAKRNRENSEIHETNIDFWCQYLDSRFYCCREAYMMLPNKLKLNLTWYSLCYTNSDRQTGQSQAYQQHTQEEEVGAGSSERTCGWTAVVHQ